MKNSIVISFLLSANALFAQENKLDLQQQEMVSLRQKLNNQQVLIIQQKTELEKLSKTAENQKKLIDSLKIETSQNEINIQTIANDLGTKIQTTETNTKESISKLDEGVEKNRLYWIIGTLITLIISGLIYLLLGKRIATNQTDVEGQIRNTKKSLEEEGLKLDNKLIEVLETQLKVQQEETKNQTITINEKTDHSLALKVADEIVRMQKNISRMDADIKGLKPLEKGIERIQANFEANGYEMINLLNSEYDERMNIDVINFVEDDTLESGKKIISKIIKPQVNFNGILIQRAQVEVSQN